MEYINDHEKYEELANILYKCKLCHKKFNTAQDAEKCFDKHYRIGKIIGIYYDEGKRCPSEIQVEISLGNDGDFQKDVFFENTNKDGWGAK